MASLSTSLLLSLVISSLVSAFNVDVKHPIVHRGPANSQFGWAVDYFTADAGQFWLAVGAPRADSRSGQPGVRTSGAVYRCSTESTQCSEIFVDRLGNDRKLNGSRLLQIEEKSNQLLGTTVVASKKGDRLLACGPHYKYFFSKFEVIEPVGHCYLSVDNFSNFTNYAPCKQEPARHGYHRFGYGMCGFSAAFPRDSQQLLYISAPGIYYWQGGTFAQSTRDPKIRPNTPDSHGDHDNNMLGYSSASGDFNGDNLDDIVMGVPRGNELIGMVSIYTDKLVSLVNLTDSEGQRGQYFGGSVAVTDLNNDGLDDIIVGSPLYTVYTTVLINKTQEKKPQYEIGKVHIFFQSASHVFTQVETLIGHTQWSRFGHSVAAAGDLNQDGYKDFIVGAPFDGEDGRGAVYVYHGAKDGVRKEPTQKIDGREVNRELKAFGFSLTGGRDIDKNQYPDIAVGAWQSAHAVVFKTKPVITVTGQVRTRKKTIRLDDKSCTTEIGKMACEKLEFCLKYDGKGQAPNKLDLKLRVQLDSKKTIAPRAFFVRKDIERKRNVRVDPKSASQTQPDIIDQVLSLKKGAQECETHDIYVSDTIRDKLSPIQFMINYTYEESASGVTVSGQLEPAIDTTVPQALIGELAIDKNCGSDEQGQLPSRHPEKFTVGAVDQSLIVNVSVKNNGEDAYESQFFLTVPDGFEYGGIENYATVEFLSVTKQSVQLPVSCSPPSSGSKKQEEYVFACDIGNPLPHNGKLDFGFRLSGTKVNPANQEVNIKMHANSTSPEELGREGDNSVVLRVPLEIKTQLALVGRSEPEQLDYSIRNRSQGEDSIFDTEIGPLVSHLYQVHNRGPSAIRGATLDIFWPSYSETGKHLLYLIDVPTVSDSRKAVCRVKQNVNVNPASLTITGEHRLKPATETLKRLRRAPEDEMQMRAAQVKKNELKAAVRTAKAAGKAIQYTGPLNRASVDCNTLNCTHIECEIKQLAEDEFVLVEVFGRLWVNTLIDDGIFEAHISSLGLAKISALPNYSPPAWMTAVTTDVNPTDPDESQRGVPWWLYLLAILIGLTILLLLILCLWRCGFFKRNRPPQEKATFDSGRSYYADVNTGYAHPHTVSHGAQL